MKAGSLDPEFQGIKTAVIVRIQPFGLFLSAAGREILVRVPYVSKGRMPHLQEHYHVGQVVRVNVLQYIELYDQYNGTMIDVPPDGGGQADNGHDQ